MSSTRFLQCSDYKYCVKKVNEPKIEYKPHSYVEIKTLLTLLHERVKDFNLVSLVLSIATAIQITSGFLRKMSKPYIKNFLGFTNFPDWGETKFNLRINKIFANQIIKTGTAYMISSPFIKEPFESNDTFRILTSLSGNNFNARWTYTNRYRVPHPHNGKYVVIFCGVDGPCNIKKPICASSSFGIYEKLTSTDGSPLVKKDQVLQNGKNLLIAGYAIYGSTTTLHIGIKGRTGGSHSFSLTSEGDFILTSEDYLMPRYSTLYSADEGRCLFYSDTFLKFMQKIKNPPEGSLKSKSTYCSSMLADIHQIFLKGGIYLRPMLTKPCSTNTFFLVYELIPAAFVMCQAGGLAVCDGNKQLLDVKPTDYLESKHFLMGSFHNVTNYLNNYTEDPLKIIVNVPKKNEDSDRDD